MSKNIKHFTYNPTGGEHTGAVIDSKEGFDIIECETCGFKHVVPIPTPEELNNLYKKEFYSTEKPNYFKDVEEDLEWWEHTYHNFYHLLEKHCPTNSRRLLEIGSGPGYFLKSGKELGWDVLGFEPSKQAAEYSKTLGVNVVNDFFNETNADRYGTFDVVYMKTVIEHLPDPVALLKSIKSVLKPNGIICIISPNEYNPLQLILREMGHEPWWVAPPQHINYFDFKSIKKLLEKIGFDILESTATFPMEFFLLAGENYVGNDELGRKCHFKRKIFEMNLYKLGSEQLNLIYKSLADNGIGREFVVIGRIRE